MIAAEAVGFIWSLSRCLCGADFHLVRTMIYIYGPHGRKYFRKVCYSNIPVPHNKCQYHVTINYSIKSYICIIKYFIIYKSIMDMRGVLLLYTVELQLLFHLNELKKTSNSN